MTRNSLAHSGPTSEGLSVEVFQYFSELVSFCNNTFFFGVASVVNGFYHLRRKGC